MGSWTGQAAATVPGSRPSHRGLLPAAASPCSTLAIPDTQVNNAGGVGPLTAWSPTKWRPGSTTLINSSCTIDRGSSASAVATARHSSSHQPGRQHQLFYQLTDTASSQAAAAAAAKVEAEADAIAARVAAAAALLNQAGDGQQRHQVATSNSSCPQQQDNNSKGDLHQLQQVGWRRHHGEDRLQQQSGASPPGQLPQWQQQQEVALVSTGNECRPCSTQTDDHHLAAQGIDVPELTGIYLRLVCFA